jgi:hypothetical protein
MTPRASKTMPDLVIRWAVNGYIIEQRKSGHDWTNRWVAKSTEDLAKVIIDICKETEKETEPG